MFTRYKRSRPVFLSCLCYMLCSLRYDYSNLCARCGMAKLDARRSDFPNGTALCGITMLDARRSDFSDGTA